MGGLAVLALLGLYGFLALTVFQAAKTTSAKVIAVLLILLIPTADAIYGRIKLQQMCKAESGLKVYRVVHGVEGFAEEGTGSGDLVKSLGYKFMEGSPASGPITRFSQQNDSIVIEENVTPQSKFKLSLVNIENKKTLYWRQQYVIETIPSGEVLATDTQIGFRGGWAERLIALFSDSGGGSVAVCNSAGLDYKKLVLATLKH